MVAAEASYSSAGARLNNLKRVNFVFGMNGVGKTTISRVIGDPDSYSSCSTQWDNGHRIPSLVYNKDFVERNYSQQIAGIFTLGESAKEILDRIAKAKENADDIDHSIVQLNNTLGLNDTSGKRGELSSLRARFEVDCWKIKTKYDTLFKNAFSGVRNSQAKFCDRVLAELEGNNADLVELDELKRKAGTLFEEGLVLHEIVSSIDFTAIQNAGKAPVLAKKVVGKEDVDVAALIRRLGNSDWVKQGLSYLAHESQCPFCQQEVDASLYAKLNDYFDEVYVVDLAAITATLTNYRMLASEISRLLDELMASENRHIDRELLRADADRLTARLATNLRLLEAKVREPSTPIMLEPINELAEPILAKISAANALVSEHNDLVRNIASERSALVSQIWKFVIHENSTVIENYRTQKKALDKAVYGLRSGIAAKEALLHSARVELRELEKSVTSVQPTVNAINSLLASFGFTGFRLKTSGGRDQLYEIVRDDGGNAAATLSEGEKSFVCFLYFYHLLRGSTSESGVTSDRIVVFDDPVSSLDSDVLFIVSALIKRILKEACDGTGQIKQVFILTHNIYFHKEVSFDPSRGTRCRSHETFWIVRKIDGVSTISNYDHNPIKTSYELLWSEVKNPNRSNTTIQNTLRRIVEAYFKILGNIDTDKIIAKFEGKDQQICASLFAWVNDGSHGVHDDLYISADDGVVARYLRVFRAIFEKTDHLGHYLMMMGQLSASVADGLSSRPEAGIGGGDSQA